MLAEVQNARQIPGEGMRRWFRDEEMDLIVWYDGSGGLEGFQLCYDKLSSERALTWRKNGAYQHNAIDDGDISGGHNMSPVLVADGVFEKSRIAQVFDERSANIDPALSNLIREKLEGYPLQGNLDSIGP